MSRCQNCGNETVENAKFCSICGYRLDEKKSCKACGELNDKNAVFCSFCGVRIDGKKVCKDCQTVFEGNFCPECGWSERKFVQTNEYATMTNTLSFVDAPAQKKEIGFEKVQNILGLIAQIVVCIGAIIALIFTFLIGFKVDGNTITISQFNGFFRGESWMYDFFGKVYENIDFIVGERYKTATLIANIVGTSIVVFVFLYVFVYSIIAVVISVKSFKAKEASVSKAMIKVIAGYLFGASGLFALNNAGIKFINHVTEEINSVEMTFNVATEVGVILCLVLFGIYFILNQIATWKKPTKRKICVWVFSCVSIGLLIAMYALSANSGLVLKFENEQKILKCDVAYINVYSFLIEAWGGRSVMKNELIVIGFIEQILAICLLIFITIAILTKLNIAQQKENLKCFDSIGTAIFATLILVFSLIEGQLAVDFLAGLNYGSFPSVEVNSVYAILICVFALVESICSIVGVYLEKYFTKEESV